MEINIKSTILLLSIITTAMSAGIFYAWTFTVIPGTKKVSDQVYIETMRSINKEILNPGFFFVFFGTVILLFAITFIQYQVKAGPIFFLLLSSALIYTIGTIGVTMFGNVPLNNAIETMDISSFSTEDFRNARMMYEDKWNQLNTVRTGAALASFILLILSIIK